MKKYIGILCFILFLSCGCGEKPQEKVSDLSFLCSTETDGRLPGTEGHKTTQAYISKRFEALNLLPLEETYKIEGLEKTYLKLQDVFLSVEKEDGSVKNFEYGKDFSVPILYSEKEIEVENLKNKDLLNVSFSKELKFVPSVYENLGINKEKIAIKMKQEYETSFENSKNMVFSPQIKKVSIAPQNIVGYIKGEDSKKALLISAHYDHVGKFKETFIEGAFDNASGVCMLLSICEKFEDEKPPCDIIFAALDLEEVDFSGSKALNKLLNERYEYFADLNLDCVGYKGNEAYFIDYANSNEKNLPILKDFLKKQLEKKPFEVKTDFKNQNMSSDHMTFDENCKYALCIYDSAFFKPHSVHSVLDTQEKISEEEIEKVSTHIYTCFLKNNALYVLLNEMEQEEKNSENKEVEKESKTVKIKEEDGVLLLKTETEKWPYQLLYMGSSEDVLKMFKKEKANDFVSDFVTVRCFFEEEPSVQINESILKASYVSIDAVCRSGQGSFSMCSKLPPMLLEKIQFESFKIEDEVYQKGYLEVSKDRGFRVIKVPFEKKEYYLEFPSVVKDGKINPSMEDLIKNILVKNSIEPVLQDFEDFVNEIN